MKTLFVFPVFLLLVQNLLLAQDLQFDYRPSPIDNPIRGLVPYAAAMPWLDPSSSPQEKEEYLEEYRKEVFPHSIEFHYFSMRELMPAEGKVDFAPIEKWLWQSNSRGCQLTFRIYLEYPTKKQPSIPQFLVDKGVRITKWKNGDKEVVHAPDYNHPKLREAVDLLVSELGKKYDGDPRIACLTMGILGHWGEWHSYPRSDLFPKKKYQAHLMEQFGNAFQTTPVLMRYPANDDHDGYASNAGSKFGYHDDSFAWATIDTGKDDDSWFFMATMNEAGTQNAWKTRMIAGEIRPEVWGCVFDPEGCEPQGQEFDRCVDDTHVTWLMDSGMFGEKGKPSAERVRIATAKVGRMGYEFFIPNASVSTDSGKTTVDVSVVNRGVAPFYSNWPVEVAILDSNLDVKKSIFVDWKLPTIQPGDSGLRMARIDAEVSGSDTVAIRIPNPMKNGLPVRFANETQQLGGNQWMLLK